MKKRQKAAAKRQSTLDPDLELITKLLDEPRRQKLGETLKRWSEQLGASTPAKSDPEPKQEEHNTWSGEALHSVAPGARCFQEILDQVVNETEKLIAESKEKKGGVQ